MLLQKDDVKLMSNNLFKNNKKREENIISLVLVANSVVYNAATWCKTSYTFFKS